MQILSLNFLMYTVGGIWRPIKWCSSGLKVLYNIFTILVLLSLYFLVLTQFLDIVLIVDNIDDFTTNSLMLLTIVAVCCKATLVVVRRNAIINLVRMLLKDPYKLRDADEMAIQRKFDTFIRSYSIKYSLLCTTSLTGVTIGSVLNIIQGYLPYRVWLPYDSNIATMFWITSMQQIISLIFATVINVGTETLISGFILQTCAQIEIFQNRLHKLMINQTTAYMKQSLASSCKGTSIFSEYIRHHLKIYDIIVLCTSVYYLSQHITESGSATFIVYTIGMFVQIYIYCWSGNEAILKSTSVGDVIYQLDWHLLSVSEKKDLLMIMIRTTIPIKFTSSFLITLSHESYSNILKTSYSAFNLLQRS
ncbi:odorant receptor 13a isoform X3 [Ooceraea biroi]|uniref:odorant receptor 13a isoform X3 n=1 Tax=Ooceraea biroi TaxID=2015173 RepID=UPI0005BD2B14|nr:odorant receptor 13a isoform X3 [Ooceraea biroi]